MYSMVESGANIHPVSYSEREMPDPKPYPRPFHCGSPTCEKVLGIIDRDVVQHNVSLYILRNPLACDIVIEEQTFTRKDFSVMKMGYGVVPCSCGHDTTWHWNQHLLDTLIRRSK